MHSKGQFRDKIRILKAQTYKQMPSLCRKEHFGLGIRGAQVLFPLEASNIFLKFYNPNLYDAARCDKIKFKTKNSSGDLLSILSLLSYLNTGQI